MYRSPKRALRILAILGIVAGLIPLALALLTEEGLQRELIAVAGPITGWAFIGTGIYVSWRRPESRFGMLMTAVGFASCLGALRVSTVPLIYGVGLLFIALPYALLYHMVLAFPRGVLRSRLEVALVVTAYLSAGIVRPVQVLLHDSARLGLPDNALLVVSAPELVARISTLQYSYGLFLMAALGVLLFRRWTEGVPAYRRRLLPVLLTAGTVFALIAAWYVAELAGAPDDVGDALEAARVVALPLVPFGFVVGLLHSRMAGASRVTDLLTRFDSPIPDATALRDAVAATLEDPTIELAYWLPDEGRYVDRDGRPVELPPEGSWRGVTIVDRDGRRIGAVIHDATLFQTPDLLRAAAATIALALDNARLHAELRARLDELRTSRARIVRAADDERKRIERNLHDGTQQRLTSVAMALGLGQSKMQTDPAAAAEALTQARAGLTAALAELRNLSQGIHPGILTERGLRPAIEDIAYASPVPVRVTGSLERRLPEQVEAAAYYLVAEALANVTKHADASAVDVLVELRPEGLAVSVIDDGRGGADPALGTGLKGLADRVQVLGGVFEIESDSRFGTRVWAVIPCV